MPTHSPPRAQVPFCAEGNLRVGGEGCRVMRKLLRCWWVLVIGVVVLPPVAVLSAMPAGSEWKTEVEWLDFAHFRFGIEDTISMSLRFTRVRYFGCVAIVSERELLLDQHCLIDPNNRKGVGSGPSRPMEYRDRRQLQAARSVSK